MSLTLDGGERSISRPDRFVPGKNLLPTNRRLVVYCFGEEKIIYPYKDTTPGL